MNRGFGPLPWGWKKYFCKVCRIQISIVNTVKEQTGVINLPFIPYSNDPKQEVAITVDNQGRINLSAGLRRKLGCENEEIELILFFEEETRRIGIAKEYPGKNMPFKFDKTRGYCKVEKFLNDNDIEFRLGAVRYTYDGTYNGVMAFRSTQRYENQIRTDLRQEKNGNLERLDNHE